MKAIRYHQFGPPELLTMEESPIPMPGKDQLLVRVHAAGVNPVDWKVRKGDLTFLSGKKFPKIPGGDFAGVVEAVGTQVKDFKPGDPVFGLINAFKGGAYAEYLIINQSRAAKIPDPISMEEAAAMPIAGLTAWQGIVKLGKGKKGGSILINGGSGGVGTYAIQIAKAFGMAVTAVSSGKNLNFCKELGADQVVDYQKENIFNLNQTWDIFFDVVPNQSFGKTKKLLNNGGVYISTLPNFFTILIAPLMHLVSHKKAYGIMVNSNTKDLDALAALVKTQKLQPIIDAVMPWDKAAEAHHLSEDGKVKGKIVLTIHNKP